MQRVILHVQNEDPILGEIDALPSPTDTNLLVRNPRRKDGKEIHYLDAEVTQVIWPLARVTFIEIISEGEEDDLISHVRE